ncbi:putative permease IIC component [Lactiplantibacillus plantarum subsp. plantarum]|uniref:Putative permease IIC component n=1 Tax=Lactiplantibacillus plantarum subsp. plantarum TaxID=337330 RepID=A0A2S3U8A1_LACPN|nr:putative permease IIC component [Lactiplantibacillus plantarum subsp. plantarum]
MLPIMIFIIALIFRVKPAKALRSALTIGIGMVGINLVINLLTTNIGPAAKAMVKRFGFHLTIVDVGWPSAAAGAWAQPISSILIPILLVVNIILIMLKVTKTLDIDIWNYWHMVAAGSVAYICHKKLGLQYYFGNFIHGFLPYYCRQNCKKRTRFLWIGGY